MFDTGTFISGNTIPTKTRLTLLISIFVQGTLLVAMILLPLMHPEILSLTPTQEITVPIFTRPLHVVATASAARASGPSTPGNITLARNEAPRLPSPFAQITASDEPVTSMLPMSLGNGPADLPACASCMANIGGPVAGPMRISSGVMSGRLIVPITPVYPAFARASGTRGTVVINATISADGSITNARVVSGPAMLYNAALDAVRRARYAPYKLSGQPVEVQTTINIVFNLN